MFDKNKQYRLQYTLNIIIKDLSVHIHILGICGTFMAGLAVLAKEQGYQVTGSDASVYPPMSTMLSAQHIEIIEGYDKSTLPEAPDYFIIGNALSRGNPAVEHVLNGFIPYLSGPEFLAKHILQDRWVVAVAGTHGKTTTSSMLAWILEYANLSPGFLIGGAPQNFSVSARLGQAPFFVLEADEYDSAFFDKRSKFIHYHPRTLVLNNCEFDHADIFDDLGAIKKQFNHLLRTVPSDGLVVSNANDKHLNDILAQGCWTPVIRFLDEDGWQAEASSVDCSVFSVSNQGSMLGEVSWGLIGVHNMHNALAAIIAARHCGVTVAVACAALCAFLSVKRRLEILASPNGITVYDDFAHHPSAIASTLESVRKKVGPNTRILAVLDCASYTMCSGAHNHRLSAACMEADLLFCKKSRKSSWAPEKALSKKTHRHYDEIHAMINDICQNASPGDHIVIMSNAGFDGLHEKLLKALGVKQYVNS